VREGPRADDGVHELLAALLERVAALEQRLPEPPVDRAEGRGAQPPAGPPAGPAGPPDDPLWALHALQARLPPGAGAVLMTGVVPLADGGLALWQQGHPTDALLDTDLDAAAARLSALASPVRLRLLREVLQGRTGSGELSADPQFGTSGQVHHHLRQLVAAGWLRPTARGRYAVPAERVVPLLVAWAAAGP
jgi:hypothetical protein